MSATEELRRLLDEFEHECYMIRVEASETRARDDVVRKAYERQREKTAQEIAATLGESHPYEQRIAGDGSDWGEIMADAFDSLMSSASESCTPDEMRALESHIAATLGGGECENANDVMKSAEIGFRCSECGSWDDDPQPRFCHNCGRKVKR